MQHPDTERRARGKWRLGSSALRPLIVAALCGWIAAPGASAAPASEAASGKDTATDTLGDRQERRVILVTGSTGGLGREVALRLPMSELRFLDSRMRWVVEPGTYRVLVGASSMDIRLRGDLVIP